MKFSDAAERTTARVKSRLNSKNKGNASLVVESDEEQGLVSTYTLAQFKPKKETCNESMEANELNRAFKQGKELSVVVSDLTYIKVRQKWHYVCVFVDLFNREIIGHSVRERKDTQLVHRAFASIPHDLRRIRMFHTRSRTRVQQSSD